MEENSNVVNDDLTNQQPSEGETQEVKEEVVTQPAPGSKTPPELLLKSLQEERDKIKKLEEEKRILEEELNTPKSEEVFSDEGKVLERKITSLTDKINQLEEEKSLEKLYSEYPVLREKSEEFKEFRKTEHPKAKMESVAKLYLVENGFYEQPRKGLEKPTGGTRTPMTSGMTADEIKTLRETNYKKYSEMLMKGQIKMES
jgi:hypothetical protein